MTEDNVTPFPGYVDSEPPKENEAPEHLDLVDKELWYFAGLLDEMKRLNRWMVDLNNNLVQINENGRWMAEWFKGLSDDVQAELAKRGAAHRPTPRWRFTPWRKS